MTSTFHGIETARRSLFTQLAALNTTGHNIANANTAGYSRQVVKMQASIPIEVPGLTHSAVPGQLGTGVEFSAISRIREGFLDDQFRNENKSLGSWTIQQDTLEKLEKVFNEPSDAGLRTVIDKFWSSWSDLSKNPENTDVRIVVKENANALVDAFQQTSKGLSDLSGDLTQNIAVNSDQINTLTSQIKDLNSEIQRIEGVGDDANDLRDQRDLLTDQLSKIVNIAVQDSPQGYTITMGKTTLVSGGTATSTSSESLESAMSSGDLTSGEVYGMLISRDKFVKSYVSELDKIANTLATGKVTVTIPAGSVLPEGTVLNGVTYSGAARTLTSDLTVQVDGLNGLHKLGYTFGTPSTADDFFTSSNGGPITASSIQVNQKILNDANQIATSMRTVTQGSTETVVKGNNTLALLISQLKDSSYAFNSNANPPTTISSTVDDYFRSVVGQLGVQSQEATRQATNATALTDQVDSRRQSVSGVSLDEEMSNMIMFQHAYGAAARLMTTFDQNLDKIINGMGVVGR